jgi:hypothetical protein
MEKSGTACRRKAAVRSSGAENFYFSTKPQPKSSCSFSAESAENEQNTRRTNNEKGGSASVFWIFFACASDKKPVSKKCTRRKTYQELRSL